ncbi:MAG: glutamine transporter ATP-binding protein [Phycisphaerales bacterium]|nr:glutamine transporter ATP-binding protein [Phycisphaerales bacterium]
MPIIASFCANFLPGLIEVTPGTRQDYQTLARFHYLPKRPATWAAIVAARWQPDVGPPRTIGVAILSHPSALHRTRHRVFGLRPMRFGQRLHWVNANLRTVSRVIIHPQFRGIGLSTPLIEAAIAACPTRYVEASARMGRAHPLFERAGFTRVEPLTVDEAIYYWRETPSPRPPPVPSPVVRNGRGLG